MPVVNGQNKISANDYLVNKKRDERQTGDGTLGKDDFMKLLIAQLQNQDPTNPMKDNEFIAQMAQFSALEQTMNLAKSFEKFAEAQNQSQLIQYNSFVGKEIKWHQIEVDDNGNVIEGEDGNPSISEGTGIITSIKFVNGSAIFTLEDGRELTPGNISEVMAGAGNANSLVEASLLIGKTVGYTVGEGDDKEEKESIVESVTNKNGNIEYVLADGTKTDGKNFISIS